MRVLSHKSQSNSHLVVLDLWLSTYRLMPAAKAVHGSYIKREKITVIYYYYFFIN